MKATAYFFKLLVLFSATACDRSARLAYEGEPDKVHTIFYLKSLCTQNSIAITEEITIAAFVTANDRYGEFFKTLVIEDRSGGIEIAIERTDLANEFPVGAAVKLSCNGLYLGRYGDKIQIGAAPDPDGNYSVARIGSEALARYLRRSTAGDKLPEPVTVTFDAVGPQHIDTYVRFDNVRFVESGAWCDFDPETSKPVATERLMANDSGRTFVVRTAGTCTYATKPMPQGTGSVGGIIDYFNGKYTLRISAHRVDFPTTD